MLAWKKGHMVLPTLPTPEWLWAPSNPNVQFQYIPNIETLHKMGIYEFSLLADNILSLRYMKSFIVP